LVGVRVGQHTRGVTGLEVRKSTLGERGWVGGG